MNYTEILRSILVVLDEYWEQHQIKNISLYILSSFENILEREYRENFLGLHIWNLSEINDNDKITLIFDLQARYPTLKPEIKEDNPNFIYLKYQR